MRVHSLLPWLACAALSAGAAEEYTLDGAPSAADEEFRWILNRGRFDRTAENQARGTSYTDVPATNGPLAPHQSLARAAFRHADDISRTGRFQHETIPGSLYYNPATQPRPYDRMAAEGYYEGGPVVTTHYGETINGGYATPAASYLGWWNSGSHRRIMYGAEGNARPRELGRGFVHRPGTTYLYFDVLNLNALGNRHFFTGTLFQDANGDGAYTQGEGRPGIRIEVRANGASLPFFDLSAAAGSFAIPIQTLPAGASAEIWLANPTAAAVKLDIPIDYRQLRPLTLAPGQQHLWGTFTKSAEIVNVGFRNLALVTRQPVQVPAVTLRFANRAATLTWPSQPGFLYQPQWSPDLVAWTNLTPAPLSGTGGDLTATDSAAASRRFYRVLITAAP